MYCCYSAPANYRVVHLVIFVCICIWRRGDLTGWVSWPTTGLSTCLVIGLSIKQPSYLNPPRKPWQDQQSRRLESMPCFGGHLSLVFPQSVIFVAALVVLGGSGAPLAQFPWSRLLAGSGASLAGPTSPNTTLCSHSIPHSIPHPVPHSIPHTQYHTQYHTLLSLNTTQYHTLLRLTYSIPHIQYHTQYFTLLCLNTTQYYTQYHTTNTTLWSAP